jgi:CxxC-x17-CxxC domain-containing protein
MALKVKCKECGNEFLIINKEIEFYKEKDFPLPELCPEHRLARRNAMRNKKELLGYNCDKCGNDIVIAFDPIDGQQVYCKTCFQAYMQENDCILGYSDGAKAAGEGPEKPTAPAPEEAPATQPNPETTEAPEPVDF